MSQIVPQAKNIDALKAFNNAIVTSRLYPPETPQVANAAERGYKGIKLFLREKETLLFSFKGDLPCICGAPIEQEILDSFPNLIIFRQLRMLALPKLIIGQEMDRFAFSQLLSVFSASPEKIKKEGGGLSFVTSLGLSGYFPETVAEEVAEEDPKPGQAVKQSRKVVKVQPELVASLCGRDKREEVESELRQILADNRSALELLVAAVAFILKDIQSKREIVSSPLFPVMLQRADTGIGGINRNPLAKALARLLADNLKNPALCVLLSQDFPEGFGLSFYDSLVNCVTAETLGEIFIILREQLAKAQLIGGAKSPRVEFFGKVLLRLMNTGRGKQFLGTEKAKTLIHEGEKERKKRRLAAGIQGLLQGNLNLLRSEELVSHLPEAVSTMLASADERSAENLLRAMKEFLDTGFENVRDAMLQSMVTLGERLVNDRRWHLVDLFLEPLIQIVRKPSVNEVLLEKIVFFLHHVMQSSWECGEHKRGDIILNLFFRIRTGQIGKSSVLKAITGKVQDRGIRRTQLPQLLQECLAAPKDEAPGYRLALQGPVAVRFLVEALINAEKAPDRMKIIDLLTSSQGFLAAIILERLPEHMPWYGKRNLIKLLGETGSEEDAVSVLPYLKHEDFRVQREAFLCLFRISGKKRKKLLLDALEDSSELIKVEIIAALANYCDQEVALQLSQTLSDYEVFSEKNRPDILLQLLDTLGRCPCQAAQKGVQGFLQLQSQRAIRKKIPEQVWSSAEKALKFLENDRWVYG